MGTTNTFYSFCLFTLAIILPVESEDFIGSAIDMEAQSISLAQLPDTIEDPLLLDMNSENRRKTCKKLLHEVTVPILLPRKKNKFYVPVAHMYEFDGHETHLAIRCPSVPATYVYRKQVESSKHQWYIRRLRPEIGPFKYNIEVADSVDYPHNLSSLRDLVSNRHRFYTLSLEERWYLCSNARTAIRYKVKQTKVGVSQPDLLVFRYPHGDEVYFSFACSTEPVMYLHIGHSENSDMITITMIHEHLETIRLTPNRKVDDSQPAKASTDV